MPLTCLDAALRYAKRGWAVFPLDGKHPFRGTRGYLDATTDRKAIRAWWRKWPDANVGIACSSEHGPIVVDVDGPSGHKLVEELALPITRSAHSGSTKKAHLYFDPRLDGAAVPRVIRLRQGSVKYEVDVLGDGGYVVAPPSVHPETGRRYKWTLREKMARFPDSIFELVQQRVNGKKKEAAAPLPKIIGEGERDQLLTSLAGSMRRRNASEGAILAALRETNETQVDPPLPDKQLIKIARSISKKEPAVFSEHLTDLGNARRFIERNHVRVRAVMTYQRPWMVWTGTRWQPDETGDVERMAKATVRSIYQEAAALEDDEERDRMLAHAFKSESAGSIRALMQLAATEPELSTTPDDYDANPWLLNVNNGTLDLRTGVMRKHRREDLITRLVPVTYDPAATAPRWELFLSQVFNDDQELIEFTQRAVGYSLTGDTREQCLFFCYGQGSNGKSTFLETLRALLGDYARQSDFASFMARTSDGPRTDLARIRGARLVTASEADEDKSFDARTVKMLTGSDTIVARQLYEREKEFTPQHKLWLAANHKPVVKEQTEGFWRRIRLIPFTVAFRKDQRDKQLAKKLLRELPGILNWAIAGCTSWREHGLLEPAAVKRATRSYREENDVLGEFLAASCVANPEAWTPTPLLYRAFVEWWQDTRGPRSQPVSMRWFGRMLSERPEFSPAKRKHMRGWRGISLKHSIHN